MKFEHLVEFAFFAKFGSELGLIFFSFHFTLSFLSILLQQSIAYFPIVLLVSGAIGSTISNKLNSKLGNMVSGFSLILIFLYM